jgi:hypothetical protein
VWTRRGDEGIFDKVGRHGKGWDGEMELSAKKQASNQRRWEVSHVMGLRNEDCVMDGGT